MKIIAQTRGNHFLSGVLLVVGTSIGAGMLGLPIESSRMGYLPSLLSYIICYCAMNLSALLFLRVQTKFPNAENIPSLSRLTVGKGASWIIQSLFYLLYYSLMIAYLKEFIHILSSTFPFLSNATTLIFTLIFFSGSVYFKNLGIKRVNSLLVIGLFVSYLMILWTSCSYLDQNILSHSSWGELVGSFPLIVTAFGFHVIIPSLYRYQGKSVQTTQLTIISGSLITLLIYIFWQTVVSGIVPLEKLHLAYQLDQTAIFPLKEVVQNPGLSLFSNLFAFCALTSSCLGVAIAFFDFIRDQVEKSSITLSSPLLLCLIFLPPLFFMKLPIPIFYYSLKYGAGFSVISLLVILPTLMYLTQNRWRERNFKEKAAIYFLILFSVVVVGANIWTI